MGNMDWVERTEQKMKEERSKEYFNIEEGDNKFILLTHCAPLPQVWNNSAKRYETAQEGDKNISIKGVCWVLQEGMIKFARLPYTIVKAIRALQNNPDWEFSEFPFPHTITVNAKGAGTKEVEYTFTASPKEVTITSEILSDLAKKPTPEEIVERTKTKRGVSFTREDYNPEEMDEMAKNSPF